MDYSKNFENCYVLDGALGLWTLTKDASKLSSDDWCDLLDYVNSLNQKIIERFNNNVSTSDVVLAKNTNRKFDKSTICLRITKNLIEDYKEFAGQLDVPVQDFMNYVLEYGLVHYRVIKEI